MREYYLFYMTKWIRAVFNIDIFLVSLLCVLAFVYLGLMQGCAPFHSPPREDFEIKMEPSKGICKDWGLIEKELTGYAQCNERRKLNGYSVFCNRRLGHLGAHHMHGSKDCYWTW